jgi:ArsR family transcriptional regulator
MPKGEYGNIHPKGETDARLDEMHAEMCKVFTNPARIRILSLLREGERSVGELAEALGVAQPTVSKHLIAMRDRAVLASRKEGTTVYYRVANRKVLRAFDLIREALVESLQEGAHLAGEARRS